jgi:hypothetical protein
MRRVEASALIPAAADQLFAFVADPANLPDWQAGIVSAHVTSAGDIGTGSTARVVRELMGQRLTVDLALTDYQPDRRLELTSTVSGIRATASLDLEPAADGTTLTFAMELRATTPFMAPLESMVAGAAQHDLEASLERLRARFAR